MSGGWLSGGCDDVGAGDRALMKTHAAVRPGWICGGCGDPWPCLVARVTLESELMDLRAVMTGYMAEARIDLGAGNEELYLRFLSWISEATREVPRYCNRPRFD